MKKIALSFILPKKIKSYFMDLSKQETPNKYIKDLIK